jgi:hypothetical protein
MRSSTPASFSALMYRPRLRSEGFGLKRMSGKPPIKSDFGPDQGPAELVAARSDFRAQSRGNSVPAPLDRRWRHAGGTSGLMVSLRQRGGMIRARCSRRGTRPRVGRHEACASRRAVRSIFSRYGSTSGANAGCIRKRSKCAKARAYPASLLTPSRTGERPRRSSTSLRARSFEKSASSATKQMSARVILSPTKK